jgi:hypothetical protein
MLSQRHYSVLSRQVEGQTIDAACLLRTKKKAAGAGDMTAAILLTLLVIAGVVGMFVLMWKIGRLWIGALFVLAPIGRLLVDVGGQPSSATRLVLTNEMLLVVSGGASASGGKVKQGFPLRTIASASADGRVLNFTRTSGDAYQLHATPDDAKTMAALIRRSIAARPIETPETIHDARPTWTPTPAYATPTPNPGPRPDLHTIEALFTGPAHASPRPPAVPAWQAQPAPRPAYPMAPPPPSPVAGPYGWSAPPPPRPPHPPTKAPAPWVQPPAQR